MSVADTTPRVAYNCNGSLESFGFSFPIIVSSDLRVILKNKTTNVATTLTETTDYSVADADGVTGSLADYENGGTITTTVIPPYSSIYQITLERAVPYTQTAVFSEGMPSLYKTFERGLDKVTMALQQLKDIVTRSPFAPADDPSTLDMEMPNATDRANKYLKFDEDGEPTAVALATSALAVTAYAESILAAINAPAARAILEAVLDEDDFVSNSEDQAPSQQSALAYFMAKTGSNLAIGSDADGDMYYRASSVLARLAKGAANLKMFMNAGATAPEWADGIKIGTFTRALDAVSGDVAYTAVGFKPSAIIFIVGGTASVGWGSIGFSNGTLNYCKFSNSVASTGTQIIDTSKAILLLNTGSQVAIVKTMDADGFTLTWTLSGNAGTATATGVYIALR